MLLLSLLSSSLLQIIRQEIKLVGLFFTWMPLHCVSCVKILLCTPLLGWWWCYFISNHFFYHNEYALLKKRIDRLKMKRSNHFLLWRRQWWAMMMWVKVKFYFWQICYSYHDWFVCVYSQLAIHHSFFVVFLTHFLKIAIVCSWNCSLSHTQLHPELWLLHIII